jgi:hypothetical protein
MSYQWVAVGVYDVVADESGRVIAKVLMGPGKKQPNQTPVPSKVWVYEQYLGEFVTCHTAKEQAERWLKLGPPTRD